MKRTLPANVDIIVLDDDDDDDDESNAFIDERTKKKKIRPESLDDDDGDDDVDEEEEDERSASPSVDLVARQGEKSALSEEEEEPENEEGPFRVGPTKDEDMRDMHRVFGASGFRVAHASPFNVSHVYGEDLVAAARPYINFTFANSSKFGGMLAMPTTAVRAFETAFERAFDYWPVMTAHSAGTIMATVVFPLAAYHVNKRRKNGESQLMRARILVFGEWTYLETRGPLRGESALLRRGEKDTQPVPEIVRFVGTEKSVFYATSMAEAMAPVDPKDIEAFERLLRKRIKREENIGLCVIECMVCLRPRLTLWRRDYLLAAVRILREYDIGILEDSTLSAMRTGTMLVFNAVYKPFEPDYIIVGKALGLAALGVHPKIDRTVLPAFNTSTVGVTHLELLKATFVLQLFDERPQIHTHLVQLGDAIQKRLREVLGKSADVSGFGSIIFFSAPRSARLSWRTALRYRILPPFDMEMDEIPRVFYACETVTDIPHVGFCVMCGTRPPQPNILIRCKTCPNAYHADCTEGANRCPDCEEDRV